MRKPLKDTAVVQAPLPAVFVQEPGAKPTKSQQLRRKLLAARLMSKGATHQQVYEMIKLEDPAISESAAKVLYYDVLKEWQADYMLEAPYHRAAQLHRLMGDLNAMRAERIADEKHLKGRKRATHTDIARHERLVAQITGAMAPVKIAVLDVNETMKEALGQVLGDMEPDEMQMLIAEGEEVPEDDEGVFVP